MLAPMVPPAPGRFSITKVCPTCFPTCSKTTRAMTSLATPAGIGTMTVTLREGQSCATADVSAAIDSIAPSAARRMMLFMVASSGVHIERQLVVRQCGVFARNLSTHKLQRREIRRRHAPLRRGLIGRRDPQQHILFPGLGAEHERERQARRRDRGRLG